jgi:hypothetical protein
MIIRPALVGTPSEGDFTSFRHNQWESISLTLSVCCSFGVKINVAGSVTDDRESGQDDHVTCLPAVMSGKCRRGGWSSLCVLRTRI